MSFQKEEDVLISNT